MPAEAIEAYVAAFVARCEAVRGRTSRTVDEPGIDGVLSLSDDAPTRLLVTDDRSDDVLASLMPSVRAGTISIVATAPRCTNLVAGLQGWQPKAVTAMIHRDLRTLPDAPLPSGLAIRPVRRLADDPTTGVPLQEAVALALVADPASDGAEGVLADHLRSMPPSIRLFAAVDDQGTVRATSGSGTFGAAAIVIFVNTDPGWRRRGIGQAMTVMALRAARDAGAGQACLEASDTAIATYLRLGFEIVAPTTQFFRAPGEVPDGTA